VIERQTGQLTRLVDDLLDVSRITRGDITLRPEKVDVATIVAAAVETCRPMIDARRHELSVRLPDQPLVVSGDPARLTQVIANLLSNAAKYQDNEGRIELIVESVAQDAVVTVRDNGIGIAPEMLPLVFDLFSRVAGAGHRSDDGLGIGLALVKKLTEMHGGHVEARSDGPESGSEFTVRLPIAEGASREAVPTPRVRVGGSLGSRRVLIVDDNRDSAESVALLLKLLGADIHMTHDGPSALAAIDSFRPEVILMDIGLPGMDGYEVARRIRQRSELDHLTLIAITGWGQEDDRRRSREAGFQHHLVKPADPAALQALLMTLDTAPHTGLPSSSDVIR
jgi:CheY-like chemotaxis protein